MQKWPYPEVSLNNVENISTDTHHSESEARIVINRLETEGFGGEGKIFPIETSIEPAEIN